MKMTRIALALAAAATLAPTVQAQDTGNWIVRGRVLYLQSDNGGSTTPDLQLSVNDKAFPEVDVSYFLSPNLALELVLTVPQEHDLRSAGTNIGTVEHLPPTLSLQYHFTGMSFRPYVGAGINYTRFTDVNITVPGASIENDSWGWAVGAGVDVPLGGGWLLNFDVKKVKIATDVFLNGAKLGDFKIDPWLWSVGVGYRF
ncbi:MAG: outer membrane beta-barrel protein [Rubrivivax sp.]|jgi:outer membrane protein|nr:outer membrane beta-barrel protein [Rubrivivax sp.]